MPLWMVADTSTCAVTVIIGVVNSNPLKVVQWR